MCICNHFRSTNTIMILIFFCSLFSYFVVVFQFHEWVQSKKFEDIYIHKTIIHKYKHTPYKIYRYIFLYDLKKKQNNKKSLFFFVCPIQRFSFKICTFFTSVRRTFISWNYHFWKLFCSRLRYNIYINVLISVVQ